MDFIAGILDSLSPKFEERKHPRGGKGSSRGGQFVSKGEEGTSTAPKLSPQEFWKRTAPEGYLHKFEGPQLTKDQEKLVRLYTDRTLNKDFQNLVIGGQSKHADVSPRDVDQLRHTIKTSKTTAPIKVFRALMRIKTSTMEDFSSLKTGTIIPLAKGFGSTSASEKLVDSWISSGRSIKMAVSIPRGSRALPVKGWQSEILFRDGARIRLDAVKKTGAILFIEASLIHDGFGET